MSFCEYNFLGLNFRIHNPDLSAYFVMGLKKSGSSMLNEAVIYLSQRNDANWVSIPDLLFQSNIDFEDYAQTPLTPGIIQKGNVYGGFRFLPASLVDNELFVSSPKILLIRDPRDALVSLYYSYRFSHWMPEGENSVGVRKSISRYRDCLNPPSLDEFVLNEAAQFNATMSAYKDMAASSLCLTLRYEDVIFRKADMLRAIAAHFAWALNDQDISDILHHIDIIPESEDPQSFVRKVTPGDHAEKLAPATIAAMNAQLAEAMTIFGYA